jgi:hypothetical protein
MSLKTRARAVRSWVKLVSELQQAYDQLGQKEKNKKSREPQAPSSKQH